MKLATILAAASRGRVVPKILVAAGLVLGVAAGADAYQRHKREIAITRLIEESCNSCTLRHAAQLRAREILRQQREAAADGGTTPSPAAAPTWP